MKSRPMHSSAILLATLMACATATSMAQEGALSAFDQEIKSINNRFGRLCADSSEWKDDGANCQKWIDAINQAERSPQASPKNKHDAITYRMIIRRLYGDGLLRTKQPKRAVEEYGKAFVEMNEHAKSGHSHAWLDGYEILTGLAQAFQETGNIPLSDKIYGRAREVAQQLGKQMETRSEQLPPHIKKQIINVLLVGEKAEQRWAQQLSTRAAQQAIAGDMAQAGALWSEAGRSFGQAASNAALADQSGASRTDLSAHIHPLIRIGGHHRLAGDQWLLAHAAGQGRDSLGLARDSYQQSQAHLQKAEAELMNTAAGFRAGLGEPDLGIVGKHLLSSQIGLGEVLVHEGKLKTAAAAFLSAQKELSPISRKEMSLRAQQGKANKRWLSNDADADNVKKNIDECIASDHGKYANERFMMNGKPFCEEIGQALDKVVSGMLLPRYGEHDIDGLRLQARLSTAKARWQGGSWQEAKADWEQVHAAAAADNGKRQDQIDANDKFALRQVQQWAAQHAASRR